MASMKSAATSSCAWNNGLHLSYRAGDGRVAPARPPQGTSAGCGSGRTPDSGSSGPRRTLRRKKLRDCRRSHCAGGCVGFLFFNYHPAEIFMGDTGSLALGGAVAGIAIVTKTELLLIFLGMVFVLEALSVILQVVFPARCGAPAANGSLPCLNRKKLKALPEM